MISRYRSNTKCRLCESSTAELLYLGLQPLLTVDNQPTDGRCREIEPEYIPLHLDHCPICGNLQTREIINHESLYVNFNYHSERTSGLISHFKTLASKITAINPLNEDDLVIDIGSNDGSLLYEFKQLVNCRVLGIEPSLKHAELAVKRGIPTLPSFLTEALAKDIISDHKQATLILIANTIANIDNLQAALESIAALLKPHGILCIETQDGDAVLENLLLDTIYHEHLSYFRPYSLIEFTKGYGFQLLSLERNQMKGGSLSLLFRKAEQSKSPHSRKSAARLSNSFNHEMLSKFTLNAQITKKSIQNKMSQLKGKVLYGFGGSIGTHTLMAYFELEETIDLIFDDNPIAPFFPVAKRDIPIVRLASDPETFLTGARIFLFSYRYRDLIIQRHGSLFKKMNWHLIQPLPTAQRISVL